MKNKTLKLSAMIIAIGLVLAVAVHLLTSIRTMPTVTEQEFSYSVTYKLDGETKTINGVYTCRFSGFGSDGIDPLDRYYGGDHVVDGKGEARCYTIAQKGTVDLYIDTLFNDNYIMGDTRNESYAPSDPPRLEAVDSEGYSYETDEAELLGMFDAEIVSWEYPEPIENSFVFAGFAGLHPVSVLAMMIVGFLTLLVCMFAVKKESRNGVLGVISIICNFLVFFGALPIITVAAYFIQAFPTGPDWIYQGYLCIPPVILFSLAASVSLRRKGFKKSGFFIQFLGPAALVILGVVEYIL